MLPCNAEPCRGPCKSACGPGSGVGCVPWVLPCLSCWLAFPCLPDLQAGGSSGGEGPRHAQAGTAAIETVHDGPAASPALVQKLHSTLSIIISAAKDGCEFSEQLHAAPAPAVAQPLWRLPGSAHDLFAGHGGPNKARLECSGVAATQQVSVQQDHTGGNTAMKLRKHLLNSGSIHKWERKASRIRAISREGLQAEDEWRYTPPAACEWPK